MAQRHITAEQRDQAILLCRSGEGRNAIARQVGISSASVSKIISEAGLSFDRERTAVATKARQVVLAEKRAKIEGDLLDDAARLRALIWSPITYRELGRFADAKGVGGSGGAQRSEFVEYTQPTPTPTDQHKLMQAAGIALDKSIKLMEAGADQGTDHAKSMLTQLGDALGELYRRSQGEGQGE